MTLKYDKQKIKGLKLFEMTLVCLGRDDIEKKYHYILEK